MRPEPTSNTNASATCTWPGPRRNPPARRDLTISNYSNRGTVIGSSRGVRVAGLDRRLLRGQGLLVARDLLPHFGLREQCSTSTAGVQLPQQ